jgi:ABC-type amino acid transport substrate-binding protein
MSRARRFGAIGAAVALATTLLAGCVSGPSAGPSSEGGSAATIQTLTPGVLKIGSQQSYIPGEFFEEGDTQVQGFSVDFVDEVAKRMGLKAEWTQIDYSAIITGLQSRQFDMGSGGMSPNPERLEQVDMVGCYQAGSRPTPPTSRKRSSSSRRTPRTSPWSATTSWSTT